MVPDADGKRQSIVTNKFGTWGVGSKGVTEDWDDDFDFNDSDTNPLPQAPDESTKTPDADQLRCINDVVDRLIREQGYCPVCANELLKYVGSLLNR